ncbi:MAG: radical SAM protein [Candidatus Omnitrophica bacterium]|nr:radical SAM protein [Candidatus Omnitrophota bacterium]
MKGLKEHRSDNLHTVVYKKASPDEILSAELGPQYTEYRKKWGRVSECRLEQDYPLHLNFEIFYGCNLRCSMCILSKPIGERGYKTEPEKRISFDKYKEIIDEGVKRGLCAVQLNGHNEPLLQDDLTEYIQYARNSGIIDIYLITNATLLTPEKAEELLSSGLTQIKFSMDSVLKETYEKLRVGGNFEKTLENINTFLQMKKKMKKILPVTRVSFVKTPENKSEVNDFIGYWSDRVDYITVQDMVDPFVVDEAVSEGSLNNKKNLSKCSMPYQRMFIRNNGDVSPCCSTYGFQLPVGNVYESSIYEIWNGKRLSTLRKRINGPFEKQPIPCRKCRRSLEHITS